jgi:cell division protein FtsA
MAHRTVVAIDVGTTKICTVVAQVDHDVDEISVLGLGLTPSKGVERGVVVNIDDTISAIASSIERAERLSGYRITAVYVAATGRYLTSLNSRAAVAVAGPDREITGNDITRATEAARSITIPMQREIVFLEPRTYVVDGNEDIRDPTGMFGYRLEVEAHIVVADKMLLENLIRSVQRSGAEINEVTIQSYAASWAVLSDDDREQGVVLVDIGGGTTDIAIFAKGRLWHSCVLPVGGGHFTNDIVLVMQLPYRTAEWLKLNYGSAIAEPCDDEEADIISAESFVPGEEQLVSRTLLNEVLHARAAELIQLILQEIRHSGYEGMLPAGIVLSGGAAQLPRFDELMRDHVGIPVRIGTPRGLTGLDDLVDRPEFATAIGLIRWGSHHGGMGDDDQQAMHESWVRRLFRFVRELWS